jgi:hypothetical protein
MVNTLLSTIIAVLVVRENKDLFYQIGECYPISPQLRLSGQEEVPIIEYSMRKETSL